MIKHHSNREQTLETFQNSTLTLRNFQCSPVVLDFGKFCYRGSFGGYLESNRDNILYLIWINIDTPFQSWSTRKKLWQNINMKFHPSRWFYFISSLLVQISEISQKQDIHALSVRQYHNQGKIIPKSLMPHPLGQNENATS